MSGKRTRWLRLLMSGLMVAMTVQLATGRPRPHYRQHKMVQDIASDTSTPQKKANVIAELAGIVQDEGNNIHLRQFAAEKLGELGAVQAEDMLKALAESLPWTDSTRYLKRSVTLAYWQIRVTEEPTREAQEALLIKLLWGIKHPPPHASVIPWWAADELANRGVKEALPEIIKAIRYREPNDRGEERIRLCTAKVELLTTSGSRQDALTQALATEDFTRQQRLKRWAIRELGKLRTEGARSILIGYALNLQSKYYDENGKWIGKRADRLVSYASEFYRTIMKILKDSRMTDSEIRATGLQPDKFFIIAP